MRKLVRSLLKMVVKMMVKNIDTGCLVNMF
jgi:hypothetical protein